MFFGICLFGKKNLNIELDNSIIVDKEGNIELNYKKLDNQKENPQKSPDYEIKDGFAFELNNLESVDLKQDKLEEYISKNQKGIAKLLFNLFKKTINTEKKKELEEYQVMEDNFSKKKKVKSNLIIDIFNNPNPPLSWQDPDTGLIWEVKNKDNFEKLYTYKEAQTYVRTLNRNYYDRSSKWRLPTLDELMTLGNINLFDYRNKNLQFQSRIAWKVGKNKFRNGKLFVKKPLSGFMNAQIETWYWTSTPVNSFHEHILSDKLDRIVESMWVVNFFEGGNYHMKVSEKNSVICVRKPDKRKK